MPLLSPPRSPFFYACHKHRSRRAPCCMYTIRKYNVCKRTMHNDGSIVARCAVLQHGLFYSHGLNCAIAIAAQKTPAGEQGTLRSAATLCGALFFTTIASLRIACRMRKLRYGNYVNAGFGLYIHVERERNVMLFTKFSRKKCRQTLYIIQSPISLA